MKDGVACDDLLYMSPSLLMMIAFVTQWCNSRNIQPVITSGIRTIEENRMVGAKSLTHPQGRAFDLSVRSEYGFNEQSIQELIEAVEKEFKSVGALNKNLESRPIVRHVGTGDHLHLQVRRNI